ncbi:hypothetical protein Ndes2526A_g05549 [Nannochloris sp. 'desiccata']
MADLLQQLQMPQLEAMCEQLYNSQNPAERSRAEEVLKVFGMSPEYVTHCKTILDNSTSPYAQLLASSSLLKVTTEHTLSTPVRLEMRSYFVSYLSSRGPSLEPFVVTSLVQLLCRMSKLGWFDDDGFRAIVADGKALLEAGTRDASQQHYLLGLKLLQMTVSEMNSPTPGRTLTQHRKVAVSFRDQCLYQAFQLALVALQHLKTAGAGADGKLREQAMSLALACLSFDFVGTCVDESAEDLGTIQIPSAWRPSIEQPDTLHIFFDFYRESEPPLSSMSLECLVRLASARRSLFSSETERVSFLSRLVNGSRDVLSSQLGLQHHANYHEFCRLLGRLKTNYQLSELVGLEAYAEWINLVANFTVDSLNSWQWASGSVYYLLGLWSRLVSSMPYLKGDAPSRLETYVPRITKAYVDSRLASVAAVAATGGAVASVAEDPLDNDEQLSDQMDSLPYLCRFQYADTAEYLAGLLDPLLAQYQGSNGVADARSLEIVEGQLTWLVHIVGAVIRGRMNSSGADQHEQTDGDLAARVFTLVAMSDSGHHAGRYNDHCRQRLDLAILSFFQNFRKVYVGEQVVHSSKIYSKLSERCGIRDHLSVLSAMLGKIATNLKVYGGVEEVVEATLTLFQDLAAGYMSGKLLLKLEAISFLLTHHTAEYFPFLANSGNTRARTTFYLTLARLLFMEDTPGSFKAFVVPIGQVLSALAAASGGGTNPAALRAAVPKETAIGLFRDLRGIASATSARRTYGQLFDFLYPAHFPTILACLDAWADVPDVTTALLKFINEFVWNKTQRLTFDSSSPNGILLFREVSKILKTYGTRALATPLPGSDPYGHRYKGIWICLSILTRALGGNYVNFGVFDLYGDPALRDALDIALQMALYIPLPDILAYRKVAKAYFAFVDVLCHNHAAALAARDTNTFVFLLSSLDAGLKSLDVALSSQCAAALDNLAGYYFRHMPSGEEPTPAGAAMAEHLRQHPDLFPRLLQTLFEIVLFEDCTNQWSLSRPMLSLILVVEPVYAALRQQIVASQPAERQAILTTCLDRLMQEVQRSLDPKNRDKFTQNLTVIRHDYKTAKP